MKRRLLPVAAAGLIAGGAVAGYAINDLTNGSRPAAAVVAAPINSTLSNSAESVTSKASTSTSADTAIVNAFKLASPSVVYVDAGTGTGSGVIYDATGDIVTNAHVTSGATSLNVTLKNGKMYAAKVLGTDAADDLAVIHINATGLTPATFATAGSYQEAQTVLAIGNPLGLRQTVTSGLISGLNRTEQEPNGAYLPNALQTSAPINPGNSGGALVALDGSVVGIPTLEQTGSTSGTTAQAIGFAIPAERVTLVTKQIIATGKVEHTGRAYLGVRLGSAAQDSSGLGFGFGRPGATTTVTGAQIAGVASSSPAGQAGLQAGDVITKFGSTPVTSSDDLLTALAMEKPGGTVSVTVNRNGSTHSYTLHLTELPAGK
jgi:putative serine protease PepD